MYSKPYRHGEYWRIDAKENGRKYYIEFESLDEAENYLKS